MEIFNFWIPFHANSKIRLIGHLFNAARNTKEYVDYHLRDFVPLSRKVANDLLNVADLLQKIAKEIHADRVDFQFPNNRMYSKQGLYYRELEILIDWDEFAGNWNGKLFSSFAAVLERGYPTDAAFPAAKAA
jgi:hypothetical protein